jgi:hypothetical protein
LAGAEQQPPRAVKLILSLQAKLSLFSSIDAPLPPSQRGLSLFTSGVTDQSRQQFRDGSLASACFNAHCASPQTRRRSPGC